MVPVWVLVLVCLGLLLSFAVNYLLYNRSKLPFSLPVPDRGHRCFVVPNEAVARLFANMFARYGLTEQMTFSSGGTHQCVLGGDLVLIWYDEELREMGLGKSALSVAVPDPRGAAYEARGIFRGEGFSVKVHEDLFPGLEGKIVVVQVAELDWTLVFRRPLLRMGRPPKMRTLTR